ENEEEAPYLLFTVIDAEDNVVRKLRAPASKGIHRVTWDLRYPKLTPVNKDVKLNKASAMLAMPGTYSVTMSKVVDGVVTRLTPPQPFNAVVLSNTTLPARDRGELVSFQRKIASLQRAVMGTQRAVQELKSRLEIIGKALELTPGTNDDMLAEYRALVDRTAGILRRLNGDATYRKYNENQPPSIVNRLQGLVYGQWTSTSSPSPLYREQYRIVVRQFTPLLKELRSLVEVDLKKLENRLEEVEAPWTPGRLPDWKGEQQRR
ncbi:MAG: glycosyl hydrolase, partial [Chlorobi bacterium]|nr:glycosyl hydrolase [Chlorobiota bacterium]